jgi:hypothetical protein
MMHPPAMVHLPVLPHHPGAQTAAAGSAAPRAEPFRGRSGRPHLLLPGNAFLPALLMGFRKGNSCACQKEEDDCQHKNGRSIHFFLLFIKNPALLAYSSKISFPWKGNGAAALQHM